MMACLSVCLRHRPTAVLDSGNPKVVYLPLTFVKIVQEVIGFYLVQVVRDDPKRLISPEHKVLVFITTLQMRVCLLQTVIPIGVAFGSLSWSLSSRLLLFLHRD